MITGEGYTSNYFRPSVVISENIENYNNIIVKLREREGQRVYQGYKRAPRKRGMSVNRTFLSKGRANAPDNDKNDKKL